MTEFLGLCLIATLLVIIFLVQKIMNDRSEHRKTLELQKMHILAIEQGHLEIEENYENDLLSANEKIKVFEYAIDNHKERILTLKAENALLSKELTDMGGNLEMVLNQDPHKP